MIDLEFPIGLARLNFVELHQSLYQVMMCSYDHYYKMKTNNKDIPNKSLYLTAHILLASWILI